MGQVTEIANSRIIQASFQLTAAQNSVSVDLQGPVRPGETFALNAATLNYRDPNAFVSFGSSFGFGWGLSIVPQNQAAINDPADAAVAQIDLPGRGIILPGDYYSETAVGAAWLLQFVLKTSLITIPYGYNLRAFLGTPNYNGGTQQYGIGGVLSLSAMIRDIMECQ